MGLYELHFITKIADTPIRESLFNICKIVLDNSICISKVLYEGDRELPYRVRCDMTRVYHYNGR